MVLLTLRLHALSEVFAVFITESTPSQIASACAGDNYTVGEDGYHDPKAVSWGFSDVSPSRFHELMEGGKQGQTAVA